MIQLIRIIVAIPLVICVLGLLWLLRPWSQYGIGSHEQSFDNYTISVPFGWAAAPVVPEEKSPPNSAQMHRGLLAGGSIWFSTCVIRIDSADEYQSELKAGRKFPNIDALHVPDIPTPTVSPVEKLTIDGRPFERAYWTVKVADRTIKGVEYRSVPVNHEDVLIIGANPGFGLPSELAQAEYLILSLKHNKR